VEDPSPLTGRVVAVREGGRDVVDTGGRRLERGALTVSIVVDGLPVGDLPAGSRLQIGATAVVELEEPVAASEPGAHRDDERIWLLEAGKSDQVAAEVLVAGRVEPGDVVALEAVALPLTDVLDLHSFRPEDTPRVVTAYLDWAQQAGLDEVRIVHGRGRGVQRAVVRRFLAEAPGVAAFTDAPPTRGGWGATVVRLHPREDAPST
jgi:DNA-nicking Smr family endonuclease